MKNQNKKVFDNDKLCKDLDKVLEKHGIDFGFFVTNKVNADDKDGVIAFAKRPGGKKEKQMASSLLDIFCQINLDIEDFKHVADLIRTAKVHAEMQRQKRLFSKIAEQAAICMLSADEVKQLESYRKLKNDCVANNDLESAARWRALELELLNKHK